jgi:fumarate reductase flavoprotein subunit
MQPFDVSVPVLVVGGGACGAIAALAAHDAGAEVLVVEREHVPRGTTSMSQGLICAAGTASQRAAGVDDDADRFYADILAKTRGLTDHRLARAIADHAGPTLDWLVSRHDLPWELDSRFRAAYGHSRLRVHGWPGHGGLDMIELLHARLQARGIDVMTDARMVGIKTRLDERGRPAIEGVELARPDGSVERVGCAALVLAAGGFAANHAMVSRYMPEAAAARCNGHEGNQGDAIRLGEQIGAAVADMGAYQGYGMLTDPQGISVPPGVLFEGGLMVNALGQRFVHETDDIAGMVLQVVAQPGGTAWVVYDQAIEARCAHIPESIQLNELQAARRGDDAPSLARAVGVDAASLVATLHQAHAAQQTGRSDAMGRDWGTDRPPSGPLLALKVCGALYHTQGGLQVDDAARVLQADGTALPNLWAGGGAARGVSGPGAWGYLPAMGLCAAMTLGALAGRHAAEWTSACASGGMSER